MRNKYCTLAPIFLYNYPFTNKISSKFIISVQEYVEYNSGATFNEKDCSRIFEAKIAKLKLKSRYLVFSYVSESRNLV